MKKMKNCIKLLAMLALVVGMCCVGLFSATGSSVTPEIDISMCNLSFSDNVYVKYAISSNVDGVKLLVWDSAQADYTIGTEKYTLTSDGKENINGQEYSIFSFTKLSAKKMGDVVYARAYK